MTKKKKEEKPAEAQTTFEAKINKYGFLHFGKPLTEAWGLTKGTEQPITIEFVEGNILIKKR